MTRRTRLFGWTGVFRGPKEKDPRGEEGRHEKPEESSTCEVEMQVSCGHFARIYGLTGPLRRHLHWPKVRHGDFGLCHLVPIYGLLSDALNGHGDNHLVAYTSQKVIHSKVGAHDGKGSLKTNSIIPGRMCAFAGMMGFHL